MFPGPAVPYGGPASTHHTQDGVRLIANALQLQIATELIAGILGIIVFLLILVAFQTHEWGAVIGAILSLAGSSILTGIIGLIAFVFLIMGFSKFFKGKHEYDSDHASNLNYAVMLLIFGMVLPYLVFFYTPSVTGYKNLDDYWHAMSIAILAGAVTNLVAVICWAKMFAYLVAAITQKGDKSLRRGAALLAAGPIISIAFILLIFFVAIPDPSHFSFSSPAKYETLVNAFAIAPWVGYIAEAAGYYSFYRAFRRIHIRMEKGKIRPLSGAPGAPPNVTYEWRVGSKGLGNYRKDHDRKHGRLRKKGSRRDSRR